MNNQWKSNIPIVKRIQIFLRDWYLMRISNPYQKYRRSIGFAHKDLFKHILIQTNYKCTRSCAFCHYGLETPPKNVDMDEGLFYDIIDQLKTIKYSGRIGLFEMNEPLTDKRFFKFLKYTRQNVPKAWLIITTNGDLLDKGKLETLFINGLNHMYLNSYDIKALSRNLTLLNSIHLNLQKKITHINRTYQTDWTSRGGNIEQFRKTSIQASCDMVYRVMYIKPTGKVYSCYNDFFDINEMGDLNTQRLLKVWYGKSFVELRDELDIGNRECNQLCSQCDFIGYHALPKVPLSWQFKNKFTI